MSGWGRRGAGYDDIPDEDDRLLAVNNRRPLYPRWVLYGGAALGLLVLILAIAAAVLGWQYNELREKYPSPTVPVVRGYFVSLNVAPSAPNNWSNRNTTLATYYAYLQSLAGSSGVVFLNANDPLQLRLNHVPSQQYNAIFHEQYYDTSNMAITALGASLRVRTYVSSYGDGYQPNGTSVVEFIYRNPDYVLATNSSIAPAAGYNGKQRIEYVYNQVSEYVSYVCRYEHRINVTLTSPVTLTSMSNVYTYFTGLSAVLPNVASSQPLSITVDHYVWKQGYYGDGIGPTTTPQALQTVIELYYPTLAAAQAGNTYPTSGKAIFHLWNGNTGLGTSPQSALDQALTLFHTVSQSSWRG